MCSSDLESNVRRVADGIEDGIGFHGGLREGRLGLNSLTDSAATRKVQMRMLYAVVKVGAQSAAIYY